MQISYGFEELDNFAEIPVNINLFEKCLLQPFLVRAIITIRPFENLLTVVEYKFPFQVRTLVVVLAKLKAIRPKSGF